MKWYFGDIEVELDRDDLTGTELDQLDVDNFFENPDGRWEREQYDKGHGVVLLFYLYELIKRKKPIPEWVAEAFCSACKKVGEFEVASWDDVFEKPLKKGGQLAARRRRLNVRDRIYYRVCELSDAGEGISKDLFDAVGKEFGVNGTLAAELYYEFERENVIKPLGPSGKI